MTWRTKVKKMIFSVIIAIFMVGLIQQPTAFAGINQWTSGGPTGVNIHVVIVSPNYVNDGTVFSAGEEPSSSGVFKSTDRGQSWVRIDNGFQDTNVESLSISPQFASDGIIFAGTLSGKIYKTSNGGQTWSQLVNLNSRILTIAIPPTYNEGSLERTIIAGTGDRGIHRSIDGGLNWTPVNNINVYQVIPSPNYASDSIFFAGTTIMVYKSSDGGATWAPSMSGLSDPYDDIESIAISPSFAIDQTVFAGAYHGNIYKSINAGQTWTRVDNDISYAGDILSLAISPNYAIDQTIFAGNAVGQVFKSSNGGAVWTSFGRPAQDSSSIYSLAFEKDNAMLNTLFAGLYSPGSAVYQYSFQNKTQSTSLLTNPLFPNGTNNWFKTTPSITLSRSEPGTTYYQWDSTSTPGWNTYSSSFNGPEGQHTLYYYSADNANNTETIQSQVFKVDTQAPTSFTQNLPAANATINKPYPYFSWNDSSDTISGLDKYGLYIDGALQRETSASITSAVPSSALSNGAHTWFVRAWDAAGNFRDSATRNLYVNASAGRMVFERAGGIYIMNADGTGQARLTNVAGYDMDPVLSPDGTKISFSSTRDGGWGEIYIMNIDGTGQIRLTTNTAWDRMPGFSPDGTRICFASSTDNQGDTDIYVMNVDGTGLRKVTNNPGIDEDPVFSPDGSKIAFESSAGDIHLIGPDGANQVAIPNSNGNISHTFTPDGTKIAFGSLRNGNTDVYLMQLNGLNPQRLTTSPEAEWYPSVAPDGQKIVFTSFRNLHWSAYLMNIDGSDETSLTAEPMAVDRVSWGPGPIISLGNTPPTTTLNATPASPNGTNLWYKTKPSATLSRDEPGASYIQWDSTSPSGWQVADSFFDVFTELQTEGQHTLYYYSVDTVNNTETVKNQLFKIDTGGPTTSSLSGSAVSATQIDLSWTAASDLVSGLAGYKIYNANTNAELATKASGTTSHSFSGLQSNTTYRYYLKAFDSAGNLSGQSNTSIITTPVSVDITPPSTPSLTGYADDGKAKLSWSAANDNIGVSGYKIYNADTLLEIAGTTTTGYSVDGLIPNTYQYYVKAYDGANNYSTPSNTVAITVPSHEASETIDGGVGGDVETPDHKAHIHLPPNAKPGSILITISRNDDSFPPIGGKNKNSSVYIFGPDGTTFDTPVTITLAYEPSADPNLIDVHWYNPLTSDWEVVTTGKTIDSVAHTIAVTVTHFSTYAVLSSSPATGVNIYAELIVGLLSLLFGFMMIRNSYKRYQNRPLL